MKRTIGRQRGSILVVTLVTIMVAVIMFSGFLRFSSTMKYHAALEYQGVQAYYVAESGLKRSLAQGDVVLDLVSGLTIQDVIAGVGTYEVTATEVAERIYLVKSYGSTGYATALASVYASTRSALSTEDGDTEATVFGSGLRLMTKTHLDGPLWYRFQNMDGHIFGEVGPLDFPDEISYPNEWQYPIDVTNGLLFSGDETGTFEAPHWLAGKHVHQDEALPELDIAEAVYDSLMALVSPPPTQISEDDFDKGNKTINLTAAYTLLQWDSKYDNTYTIVGGYPSSSPQVLEIIPRKNDKPIDVAAIRPVGNLLIFISPANKADIQIKTIDWSGSAANPESNDYRLILVGTQDIILGEGSNDPEFPMSADRTFYLGSRSILWADGSIRIRGDLYPKSHYTGGDPYLYPYLYPSDNEKRDYSLVKRDYPYGPLDVAEIQAAPGHWGPIGLIAKGDVKVQRFASRGLVYSGGLVSSLFMRVHGGITTVDPEFQTHAGLTHLWVSTDPDGMVFMELFGVLANQMMREY